MDSSYLVSWQSPPPSEILSLVPLKLDFALVGCSTSKSQTVLLSSSCEVFILDRGPVKLQTPYKISQVCCSENVILFISTSGETLISGSDPTESGILGIENTLEILFPQPIPFLQSINAVSCSLSLTHAAIIDSSGKLYTWGDNSHRQLGKKEVFPSIVDSCSVFNIVKVLCGKSSTVFLTSGGFLYTYGKIGKSFKCKQAEKKFTEPCLVDGLENEFIEDFVIGKKFVAAVTADGVVYAFDDCRELMKIPSKVEVVRIFSCKESIYCIEKDSPCVYEWRPEANERDFLCNLHNYSGNTYRIITEQVFSSNGDRVYAIVKKENDKKLLNKVPAGLKVETSGKIEGNGGLSPGIKRTSFSQLSKEFSLNIDHCGVVKHDAICKIVEVLQKYLLKSFREIREMSFLQDVYLKTMKEHTFCQAIGKIYERTVKNTFVEIREYWENETRSGVEEFVSRVEGFFKKFCFKKLKKCEKPQNDHSKIRFGLLVLSSSVQILLHKQKSIIFTMLLRSNFQIPPCPKPLFPISHLIKSNLQKVFLAIRNSKSAALQSILKLALIFQSLTEKRRSSHLLKGFNSFRWVRRAESCYTPSLSSQRTEKTFAESFEQNLTMYESYCLNQPELNSTSTQYKPMIPNKHYQRNSLPEIKTLEKLTKSKHTPHPSLGLLYKPKMDPKNVNQARKNYDLQLKQKKNQMIREKNQSKLESLQQKRKKYIQVLPISEKIMQKLLKRQKSHAFRALLIESPHIDEWKLKIYTLGFHKFSEISQKYSRNIFVKIFNNKIINS